MLSVLIDCSNVDLAIGLAKDHKSSPKRNTKLGKSKASFSSPNSTKCSSPKVDRKDSERSRGLERPGFLHGRPDCVIRGKSPLFCLERALFISPPVLEMMKDGESRRSASSTLGANAPTSASMKARRKSSKIRFGKHGCPSPISMRSSDLHRLG
jgi:hypothetical protein